MASWAALRTFGQELRLADPYGPLIGDEVITVFSPHGAPRRAREGSVPLSLIMAEPIEPPPVEPPPAPIPPPFFHEYGVGGDAPASVMPDSVVIVPDRDNPGDEGGGIFYQTASGGHAAIPAGYSSFTDIVGKNFYLMNRTLKLNTVGKIPHVEIKARLEELLAKGGGELIIDGTHLVSAPIVPDDFHNIQIVINGRHGRPTIKATKGPSLPHSGNPLIALNTGLLKQGKLFINNLKIDCTDGGNNTIAGSTTGLLLQSWDTVHLYDFGGAGGDGTTGVLNYDGGTDAFVVGQIVTGQDSAAVGTIVEITGTVAVGKLGLIDVSGTFTNNELLLGPPGSGSANCVGQLVGNLTGNQLLSTVSIYDFLWQGGYVSHWDDAGFSPSGDAARDGLFYIAQTANFVLGDRIIGSDSGAYGELAHQVDNGSMGVLHLNNVRGQFLDQEPITGLSPTAVVRGAATVDGPLKGVLGDGFTHNVRNVIFENCTNGITFKREGYSLHVDDCTFRYCSGGVTTAEVSTAFVGSGRTLVVGNCSFFNSTASSAGVLRAKGDTRVLFHNNLFRDWGRYANGDAGPPGVVWPAVRIQGCREFVINNNVFEMINWLPSGIHTGISVEQFNGALESPGNGVLKYDAKTQDFVFGTLLIGETSFASGTITGQLDYDGTSGELYLIKVNGTFLDNEIVRDVLHGTGGAATADGVLTGTTHTPFGGIARGNTYRNLDYAIREISSGSNSYFDEYFDNVTHATVDADLNVGSTLRFIRQQANYSNHDFQPIRREQVGLMHRTESSGVFESSSTTGFTLTSGSTYRTVRLTGGIGTSGPILTLATLQSGNGADFRILRTGTGSGLWQIWDENAPGVPGFVTQLAVNTWCDVQHDGTAWRLTGSGVL